MKLTENNFWPENPTVLILDKSHVCLPPKSQLIQRKLSGKHATLRFFGPMYMRLPGPNTNGNTKTQIHISQFKKLSSKYATMSLLGPMYAFLPSPPPMRLNCTKLNICINIYSLEQQVNITDIGTKMPLTTKYKADYNRSFPRIFLL